MEWLQFSLNSFKIKRQRFHFSCIFKIIFRLMTIKSQGSFRPHNSSQLNCTDDRVELDDLNALKKLNSTRLENDAA